ncbi:MAG: hypothetical protein KGI71_01650 [Patescibacteria group bacterium]|nr:hypothetical protein [Patescibacteria group bacterium]
MRNKSSWLVLGALVLAGIGLAYYFEGKGAPASTAPAKTSTATSTSPIASITTPQGVSFTYSTEKYGLATTSDQVLTLSYIPPCEEDFDYCLYNKSPDFSGTNFESAGLRIKARGDLASKQSCLTTPPAGRSSPPTTTSSGTVYATSAFPVDGAAAGHYASGTLYRLYAAGHCTEFETRIGESQYANFPAGSIQKFTDADRTRVEAELMSILASVSVSGVPVVFQIPAPPAGVYLSH